MPTDPQSLVEKIRTLPAERVNEREAHQEIEWVF